MHPTKKSGGGHIFLRVEWIPQGLDHFWPVPQKVLAVFQKGNPSRARRGPWPLDLGHDYLVKCRWWGFAPKLPSFNCLTQDRALLLRWVMTASSSRHQNPLPSKLPSDPSRACLTVRLRYEIENRLRAVYLIRYHCRPSICCLVKFDKWIRDEVPYLYLILNEDSSSWFPLITCFVFFTRTNGTNSRGINNTC